jgi:hypothetical protein
MNSLFVSIIIPYIDEHDFLQEAVDTAMAQETVEKEIIIVCNAATIPEGYDPMKNNFRISNLFMNRHQARHTHGMQGCVQLKANGFSTSMWMIC